MAQSLADGLTFGNWPWSPPDLSSAVAPSSDRVERSHDYPYGKGNQGPGTGPDGERLI
jgi:hypothetical protein